MENRNKTRWEANDKMYFISCKHGLLLRMTFRTRSRMVTSSGKIYQVVQYENGETQLAFRNEKHTHANQHKFQSRFPAGGWFRNQPALAGLANKSLQGSLSDSCIGPPGPHLMAPGSDHFINLPSTFCFGARFP